MGANFLTVVAGTSAFLMYEAKLPWPQTTALGVLLVVAVTSIGGLLELRRWSFGLEAARLVAAVPLVAWLMWETAWALAATGTTAVLMSVMLVWLLRLPREMEERPTRAPEPAAGE